MKHETKRQSKDGKQNLASRDAEMLEFGIKRASCTQVWRPTFRRAPLQFASLWIANKKKKSVRVIVSFITWRVLLRN